MKMPKRPVVPFAVVYIFSFIATAIGRSVWEPTDDIAVALALLGCGGAAVVAALALSLKLASIAAYFWCALIGGVVTFGYHIWAIYSDPYSDPIGSVFGLFLGWALLAVGSLATTRSRDQDHQRQ